MNAIEKQRMERAASALGEIGLRDLVFSTFSDVKEVGTPLGMYALGYIELPEFIRAIQKYAKSAGSA